MALSISTMARIFSPGSAPKGRARDSEGSAAATSAKHVWQGATLVRRDTHLSVLKGRDASSLAIENPKPALLNRKSLRVPPKGNAAQRNREKIANRKSGITLIELLVSSVMFAIIAVALAQVFYMVLRYQVEAPKVRDAIDTQIQLEDRLTAILEAAYLSPTTTDLTTYVIGTTGGQNPNGSPTTGATLGSTINQANVNLTSGQASDGIVLTIAGERLPPSYLTTQETDLQVLNQQYGPQGGVAEVALSTTAVGDANGKTGLFIREQRPADSDYTQGGIESLFSADVKTIGFEFYDGTQWVGAWDTTQTGQRRLPAAIRVSYALNSDPDTTHVFVVRLPLSDVTPTNPVGNGGTTSAPAGTTNGVRPAPTGKMSSPPVALGGTLPLFANMSVVPDPSVAPKPAAPAPERLAPELQSVVRNPLASVVAPPPTVKTKSTLAMPLAPVLRALTTQALSLSQRANKAAPSMTSPSKGEVGEAMPNRVRVTPAVKSAKHQAIENRKSLRVPPKGNEAQRNREKIENRMGPS